MKTDGVKGREPLLLTWRGKRRKRRVDVMHHFSEMASTGNADEPLCQVPDTPMKREKDTTQVKVLGNTDLGVSVLQSPTGSLCHLDENFDGRVRVFDVMLQSLTGGSALT